MWPDEAGADGRWGEQKLCVSQADGCVDPRQIAGFGEDPDRRTFYAVDRALGLLRSVGCLPFGVHACGQGLFTHCQTQTHKHTHAHTRTRTHRFNGNPETCGPCVTVAPTP